MPWWSQLVCIAVVRLDTVGSGGFESHLDKDLI